MDPLLQARRARIEDARLLWEWANDPLVREFSFNRDLIEFNHHLSWLRGKLQSTDMSFWIIEMDGVPVAQIRYERSGPGTAEINFSVGMGFRRKGIGTRSLLMTEDFVREDMTIGRLQALVLVDNKASIQVFKNCGFSLIGKRKVRGFVCLEYRKEFHPQEVNDHES